MLSVLYACLNMLNEGVCLPRYLAGTVAFARCRLTGWTVAQGLFPWLHASRNIEVLYCEVTERSEKYLLVIQQEPGFSIFCLAVITPYEDRMTGNQH